MLRKYFIIVSAAPVMPRATSRGLLVMSVAYLVTLGMPIGSSLIKRDVVVDGVY